MNIYKKSCLDVNVLAYKDAELIALNPGPLSFFFSQLLITWNMFLSLYLFNIV